MMESLPFSGLCDAGATPLALLPVQPAKTCDFTHRFRPFPPTRACWNDVYAYSGPAGRKTGHFAPAPALCNQRGRPFSGSHPGAQFRPIWAAPY